MYDFLNGNENIVAGEGLKKSVKRKIVRNKIGNITKIAGGTVAVLLIAVTVSTNVSPSLAYAMSDVPVLGDIVRVVTLNRYENKIGGSEAEIVTPKIEGLRDEELMNQINEELGDNADRLIAAFEKEALMLQAAYGDDVHMGVGSDYTIRTDNDDYYAIDIYFYNLVGSSSTTHKFYTVDKHTGEIMTLKGLFKENVDYAEPISEIIKNEMIRRNENGGAYWVEDDEFTEGFKGIEENQSFFINEEDNIVVCFDKYEIAAGSEGCPEFVIETELIKDILK
ncbi:MAG: DUF3298 domain-containing protein [Clostridia bacterium]|nr:DUF3298 domain-containing protein [Clostridia bacterium]